MQYILPYQVKKAMDLLNINGYEAYLVGGCVRDFIMGQTAHDYDITTSALPNEIMSVFKDEKTVPTGIKHGTITIIIEGVSLEVTTYRTESGYSDNRHPDKVTFASSLNDDLSRRDFTVNAIAYDVSGKLTDVFGGIKDIEEKTLRCVGDPKQRFEEDALRIIRALRFSSVLGFDIEKNTYDALFECKELLKNVSAERIREEFVKLLCGKDAGKVIIEYADVLGVIIPEMLPMKGFEQKNKHHIYDVLTHTAVAVDNVIQNEIIRLAVFFHDFGKPDTFTIDEFGVGHFYGHHKVSREKAKSIMARLKFDNDTRYKVETLAYWHDLVIDNSKKAIKRVLNKMSPELFFMLLEVKKGDIIAHSPDCITRLRQLDELKENAEEILRQEECFSLKDLAINGNTLIGLGIPKGRAIGKYLDIALNGVIDGDIVNDKNEILSYIKSIWKKEQ